MKRRELAKLGIEDKEALDLALSLIGEAVKNGLSKERLREAIRGLVENPKVYLDDNNFGELAKLLAGERPRERMKYEFKELAFGSYAEEVEPDALRQMENACSLPISVAGALMPDAHVGYGLPIGGVLATKDAVIPYAVGVDIACRVMLTVFDFEVKKLRGESAKLKRILEENTRFGIGANWENRQHHPVLDEPWNANRVTAELRDTAWRQLGTSGSGNHFVEFGEITFEEDFGDVSAGTYVGLVSHSGSRGPGAKVASHYSELARALHPDLPKHLSHLAWLPMNAEGEEYWQAMELMGKFASANHHIIHQRIQKALGCHSFCQVENHHNFAWRENYKGEDLIVHRKGATPAQKGVLGYIPGSMTAPGFLVEGLGNEESLQSCSHGAGRVMSRKKAKATITRHQINNALREHGVELLSGGIDEAPFVYKDIKAVMAAQTSLVRTLAKFQPRIVKMAPEGERAED